MPATYPVLLLERKRDNGFIAELRQHSNKDVHTTWGQLQGARPLRRLLVLIYVSAIFHLVKAAIDQRMEFRWR